MTLPEQSERFWLAVTGGALFRAYCAGYESGYSDALHTETAGSNHASSRELRRDFDDWLKEDSRS